MKGTLCKLLIALAILWPHSSPALDVTNSPTDWTEFISEVIPIKYAKAADVARLLGETNEIAEWTYGPFVKRLGRKFGADSIEREVEKLGRRQITADARSNSLSVCALKHDLIAIREIIARTDYPVPQILIEGVIFELPLKNFKSPTFPGQELLTDLGTATTRNFISTNSIQHGLADDFSYLVISKADLDFVVSQLVSNSTAKVLQRPRIQTPVGAPAEMFVGTSRPYSSPSGAYSYYGGGSIIGYSSIQAVNLGVTLSMNFSLTNPEKIDIEILKTVESANGFVSIANVGDVPITSRRDSRAQFTLHDGELIAIGGYVETNKTSLFSEAGFLDHVPGGGYLNKLITYPKRKTRSELILLMRTTLLPTPEVAALRSKDSMPRTLPTEPEVP
jgi:type II secretory pathway component GspD/PulD (secretin)